jgi:hypothetical protein
MICLGGRRRHGLWDDGRLGVANAHSVTGRASQPGQFIATFTGRRARLRREHQSLRPVFSSLPERGRE